MKYQPHRFQNCESACCWICHECGQSANFHFWQCEKCGMIGNGTPNHLEEECKNDIITK